MSSYDSWKLRSPDDDRGGCVNCGNEAFCLDEKGRLLCVECQFSEAFSEDDDIRARQAIESTERSNEDL
jgi:ribosomal protein S27AE